MKIIKKLNIIIITSLVILMLLVPISTIYANPNEDENVEKTSKIKIQNPIFTKNIDKKIIGSENNYINSLISSSKTYPVVTSSQKEDRPSSVFKINNGLIAYEYEDSSDIMVGLTSTNDFGRTWSTPSFLSGGLNGVSFINTEQPSMSIIPDTNYGYGTFVSSYNDYGVIGLFEIDNIGSTGSVSEFSIDWSDYEFWDFINPDVINYDHSDADWVVGVIGKTDYENETTGEGPCRMSPMYMFTDIEDPNFITLSWFPEFESCSNLKVENSYGSDDIISVCEQVNGSNQDLLFLRFNIDELYNEVDVYNMTFGNSENLIHPDVFVKNDNIYIVAETDEYIYHEIVIFISDDNGDSWTEKRITTSMFDSTNPNVFVNNTHISVAYIENNNMSYVTSDDNGNSWTTPEQLNDVDEKVVDGYNNIVIGDMDHYIWTDSRNGNDDIFIRLMKIPTNDLTITNVTLVPGINPIPTNYWVEFIVENQGSDVATDVLVEMSYKCINETPVKIEYTLNIPVVSPGSEMKKQLPLFRERMPDLPVAIFALYGIESLTVTVDPNNITDDENLGNNAMTISVDYEDIFPIFGNSAIFKIIVNLLRPIFI